MGRSPEPFEIHNLPQIAENAKSGTVRFMVALLDFGLALLPFLFISLLHSFGMGMLSLYVESI